MDLEGKIKEIIQEYADNQDEMDINAVVAAVSDEMVNFLGNSFFEAYEEIRRRDEGK